MGAEAKVRDRLAMPRSVYRSWCGLAISVLVFLSASIGFVSPAQATPGWALSDTSYPTHFSPGEPKPEQVSGTIAIDVFNIGSSAAGCTGAIYSNESFEVKDQELRQCTDENVPTPNPITVTDRLPAGVRAVNAGEIDSLSFLEPGIGIEPHLRHDLWTCTGNGAGEEPKVEGATEVTCTNKATRQNGGEPALEVIAGGGGSPTYGSEDLANPVPAIGISVDVQPGAKEHETNSTVIAGGGAPTEAEATNPVTVTSEAPSYETTNWTGWFSNADGTIDTQAGSHPYAAYFDINLATAFNAVANQAEIAGGELRTAEIELPQGFIGDPTAAPQCSRELFVAERCPPEAMVGTTTAYFTEIHPLEVAVYNLVPPPGVPAEFGFSLQGLNTFLDASVRTGSDYGVDEHLSSLSHKAIVQAITSIWGVPGDPSHDRWRRAVQGGCSQAEVEKADNECSAPFESNEKPLLTLPPSCGASLPFVLRTTSYTGNTSERTFYMHDQQSESPISLTGCDSLAFNPSLTIKPELSTTDSPTGLSVNVKPSVGGLQQPNGRSSTPIRGATVSLPPGFVVNPGEAAGLQSCSEAQAALTTSVEREAGQENTGAPSCPPASKVGTATAKSPILEADEEKQLTGSVYLLPSNPPQLKLLAALSGDGVNVKLVLNAQLNEQTGQIVTTVSEAPELPVSDFELAFDGGERASVDTPARCGVYGSEAVFTPWTAPLEPTFTSESTLGISAGVGGSPCPGGQLPLSPMLSAGSTGPVAGAFTGLTETVSRGDGQQRIGSLQFKEPLGLAAMISSVPLCPEARAAAGTCEESSLIGHATVAAGPGAHPLVIPQPGDPAPGIFLTGPYEGAPFGISIVTDVLAGPFDLGPIVTRGRIEVDRSTAQVTVTTDPLPQIVKGVPADLRMVGATVDRPGFVFNPTSCAPMAITGTVTGVEARSVGVS